MSQITSKVTETLLNAEGVKIASEIHDANLKATQALHARLNQIEEKSHCGTIRFLDKVANTMVSFANWQIKLSDKVRKLTTKINAPCSIKFKK